MPTRLACYLFVVVLIALSAASPAAADPAVHVMGSSAQSLDLIFELPQLQSVPLEIEGETFHVLEIEGGGLEGAPGEPMLPTFSRLIQIPDQAGVQIEITAVETREIAGMRPMPMQPADAGTFLIDRAAYARAGYPEIARAQISEPAIARDLRVVPITFRPVRYDGARQSLEVADRIEVRVSFTGEDLRNVKAHHHRVIPASFDQLYRELVVNYEGPREGQAVGLGSYVIICPNNGSVVSILQDLVEWRTRKGFDVYLATTAETGTSASSIQNWLRNAYNTWENPPEYITLVGDAGGSISIPCWSYSGGETDHQYCQLDGGDLLADAHIGRISVDGTTTLERYVNKIVGYESTPYMASTNWYGGACLCGDPGASGYTCVQIMQWLKDRLVDWGYTDIDTIYSSPFVSGMSNSVNGGVTVFCYRGYYGMSGFDNSDIYNLSNGWKMPYAINLTCGTGSFASGTSRSEAWIRAGSGTNSPTGGIASVGTATLGTHTRFNNCVTYGIWRGVFWDDLFTFGASFTRGKYELYVNYGVPDSGSAWIYSHWNNLMGDPAGEMWTGVPQDIAVNHPASIPRGSSAATLSVTQGGSPCEGAYVCLWKGDEVHVGGHTGVDGAVELAIDTPTAGEMLVTVTKHDHHPYLGEIDVQQENLFVGYLDHDIDDDNSGTSAGNGDGLANPGEQIELEVQVENFGTQTAADVNGTLSSEDPYITIQDDYESFGTLSGGATAWCGDDYDITIDGGAPSGHLLRLNLDLASGANNWHSLIEIPVTAAAFIYDDVTLYGVGGTFDPGETGEISVSIENGGNASGSNITAQLSTESTWIQISDSYGTFGTINVGQTGENGGNRFALSAASACYPGHQAPMRMVLQFSSGARDTLDFFLSIGNPGSSDPTGPDDYGYYAFDNTDSGYDYAPTYDWIEIAPNHGGPGADVGLSDFGTAQDDVATVDLPFPFTYYGETFTRASICSNGWMAMGSTWLTNYRNWNIPGAGAPPYMIAPMWDNLRQNSSDRVYHWHDASNHRYIVQWSRLRNMQGGSTENFEVILYDPAHYPTDTDDGIIEFQYDTFNNSDHVQHYSTVGIENGDMTDGVVYSYYNQYADGAATIGTGRAIRFVPLVQMPRGTLTGTVVNATNGNTPLEGATITLLESGATLMSGPDGIYSGAVATGWYHVEASHASFAPDTVWPVVIVENEIFVVDFALEDILPPAISGTTDYGNTMDAQGPYDIYTTVIEYSAFDELVLRYNPGGAGWVSLPLADQGDNQYLAAIPGQPYTTLVHYYIYGRDVGGLAASAPPTAPDGIYAFWVMPPLFTDDVELGTGTWSHYIVTDGYEDEWHRSEARNHTPGGSWSWKFGDTGGGEYGDMTDGALESEPFPVEDHATLSFWHWMDAEVSGSYPGYAYDGGLLEMSVDGGAWTLITPVGSYPYLVREGSGPGPFPEETPFYSGSFGWSEARFELDGITGSVRIRFRFGSDGSVAQEGWYVDDIQVVADSPGAAHAETQDRLPHRIALYQNRPNPFGASGSGTLIRFDLPRATTASLQIYDSAGRLVRTLASGRLPGGQHAVSWDGRDAESHRIPSGVYFCILEVGQDCNTKQITILR